MAKKLIPKLWKQIKTKEKFATKCVKNIPVQGVVNPVSPPIFSSSTYILDSAEHGAALSELSEIKGKSPYLYSRWGNPTNDIAANMINNLENGFGTHLTSSGMSAISTTLMSFLKSGDHIIVPHNVYGGTHEILDKFMPSLGIEVSYVKTNDMNEYESKIKNNTRMIYSETPSNPTLSCTDLKELGKLGKLKNIPTCVDSTFASPYNTNPIDLGIDIVIHSCTKYLGGHSDIIAGSITSNCEEYHKKIYQTLKLFGGILSPFDSFLLARGIKTLDVRMERHNKNAMELAKYLSKHRNIEKVFYPGLEIHPDHKVAKKQMKGFGGMISFEVSGGEENGKKLIENLKLIHLAVSLGGVESLIEQASTMTHTMVKREDRIEVGITDGLIRFSVGLEDVEDLKKDLDKALKSN